MKLAPPALFAFLLCLPLAQAQDFPAAAQEYEKSVLCKSLYRRATGMEAFAHTRDARAFKLLAKRYSRPDEPPLHVRYLVGTVVRSALEEGNSRECEDVLAGLLKKNKKPADLWLYRCAYDARARTDAPSLHAVAKDKRAKPHARAAAILALAAAQDGALLGAIPGLLEQGSLPKKGNARAVVVEACARALTHYAEEGRDALRPAAEPVIAQLDAKQTDERTKLVLNRMLQRALELTEPAFDAEEWRAILSGKQEAPGERATRVHAKFFSVLGTGRRIAYVIDLSDSMLEPLGEAEIEKLRKAMPNEAESGVFAKNRFEATKLLLANSLQALSPKMAFSIVGFGSNAELITPGMLRATPANVGKAIKALASIPVGDPGPDRPHGTLKGWTNLYGGLRLAFKVKEKGAQEKDDEYVDEDCFLEGCDMIFLLSDGEPTWSDFEGWDLPLPDDVIGDGEGAGAGSSADPNEEIQYYGPHILPRFLFADVERMNTVRNVQIHCIGIGEADPKILQSIADLGMGSARFFGGE